MLRMRKANLALSLLLGVAMVFLLYFIIDGDLDDHDNTLQKLELDSLESKLQSLENDLLLNQKTIDQIKDTVQEIKKEQATIKEESRHNLRPGGGKNSVNKTFASVAKQDLAFAQTSPSRCQIRMSDVYDTIPFDNPNGGAWKQGWDVQYDEKEVVDNKQNKLKVFVVPHSHCDPGWIKTYEMYYNDEVRHILTNMVYFLSENPKRKFVYAEVSFFALWWNEQELEVRQKVLNLLENGQFEIVGGGWVMNDEANSHYFAILEQMITGHEWLKLNLNGYKPNNGWAIDPFGLSPTMAYLQKRMGFDSIAVQRSHYAVKKYLAKEKDLEFKWRQHWDHADTTDMLTHMFPFYSYDIPHTCGPDPKVCCQFDFDRLSGGISTCPWKVPPKEITVNNVAERSSLLLDQWRKKAELYRSRALLVPLGDDFRYTTEREWRRQTKNYEKIFDHINGNPQLNAEVQWGTLEDYFTALREESNRLAGNETGLFKTLSGDFFTYADRDDHYWSGYFTSRPYHKAMDRVVQGYLRASEILFSMMWAEMEYVGSDVKSMATGLMTHIIRARQNFALFQHHDGVTGTAKDHVVRDYAERLHDSLEGLQGVMSYATHYLLTPSKTFYKPKMDEILFDLDEDFGEGLPKQFVIQMEHLDEASMVVIFNSHARKRTEVVTVKVSDANVRVYRINNIEGDDEEEAIPCQLSPVFDDDQGQISNTEFYLSFLAQVKGLGLQTYYIKLMRPEEGTNMDMEVAGIRLLNHGKHPFQVPPFERLDVLESGEPFSLQNGYVRVDFSGDGFINAITTLDDKVKTDVVIEFVAYGTRNRGDKSGAYLFLPDGPAKPLLTGDRRPLVKVVEGKIVSTVDVHLPFCKHTVTVKSSPGADGTGVHVDNLVDWRKMNNRELAMRIKTGITSGKEFFTDLNGFQMIKRKRLEKIPLQANYYPMPSMAYIQDADSRLTLVSRQPLGASSLTSGELEVMLDRRLMQDDNRGVQQGVTDNVVTKSSFYLLLERKINNCKDEAADPAASYPTLLSLSIRHSLINPLFRLIWANPSTAAASALSRTYEPVDVDLACDIHVINLRTMQESAYKQDPSDEAALIVHRHGFNACYKPVGMTCSTNGGKLSLETLFPELFSSTVNQMSLSLLYDGMKVEKGFTVSIKPMEVYSFLLKR